MSEVKFGSSIYLSRLIGLVFLISATGPLQAQDSVLVLPGLDPNDRTPRVADGYTARYGPASRGGVVEWREQIGTFQNPRNRTLNTTIFRGFNYDGSGSLINPAYAAIGSGEEHAFQPYGSGLTYSEIHPARFTPPGGGVERRMLTAVGIWETGQTALSMSASIGAINYQGNDGQVYPILQWQDSTSLSLHGNGFYYDINGQSPMKQLNAGKTGWVSLPYMDGSELIAGYDPTTGKNPPVRVGSIRLIGQSSDAVPTPAVGSLSVFMDSATGDLAVKRPNGKIARFVMQDDQ
ncbi:MAG TPA: hypothetical protein VGJ05_09975 [Fimbriiglobus sp.]